VSSVTLCFNLLFVIIKNTLYGSRGSTFARSLSGLGSVASKLLIECFGGAVGSPRAHGMFRNMCEIGTAHVTCQAGVSSTTTTNETWSILGIDHRRPGICPTESRGDGGALYVDRRSLRKVEYVKQRIQDMALQSSLIGNQPNSTGEL